MAAAGSSACASPSSPISAPYLSPFRLLRADALDRSRVGIYSTPAIHINVKGVCTNTVAVCAYRGAGRPRPAIFLSVWSKRPARQLGMSPDAIRRVNFVAPLAMPYTSPTKLVIDSGEFEKVMDRCMAAAEWSSFGKRLRQSKRAGKLRGIGMATYTVRCGGGFPETASIEFKDQGVELVMGNQEYGTGLVTSYKQVAVGPVRGSIPTALMSSWATPTVRPQDCPGRLARTRRRGSRCTRRGARSSTRARSSRRICWKVSAQDVVFADGKFQRDLAPISVSFARGGESSAVISKKCRRGWSRPRYDASPVPTAQTFPTAAHRRGRDRSVDRRVAIEATTWSTISDAPSSTMMLEGQVHGGIAQGIGQALFEHAVYDPESGQLLSGSFMDYAMPRASNTPSYAFSTHNVRRRPIRSASRRGRGRAVGAPPAIINAIVDAIHDHAGVRHIDMTATPSRVWALLNRSAA